MACFWATFCWFLKGDKLSIPFPNTKESKKGHNGFVVAL